MRQKSSKNNRQSSDLKNEKYVILPSGERVLESNLISIRLDGRVLPKDEYRDIYNLLLPFTMRQSG